MLYRKLGRTDREVSVLGFGCMRLPVHHATGSPVDSFDPSKPIDEEKAAEMIHFAVDQGINYFDTAYVYHSGESEVFLGKTLKEHRSRIMLATKLPVWMVEGPADFDRFLDEQLSRLQTSQIDFYLLHGLEREIWAKMLDMNILNFLDKILADGRAAHVGFSFHDDLKTFKTIVDAYDWSMCLIQYNYYDENYQAGKEGLLYASSKGLGVVVMEPLRGGRLATGIPKQVQAIWDTCEIKRTPAEWAFRWVWNHPQVSVALSGMSSMEQLRQNIRVAGEAAPESLTSKELDTIQKVKEAYKKMVKIDCTGCAYCLPCPNGVNIPLVFTLYNDTFMFEDPEVAVMVYNNFIAPEQRAANCSECGECVEQCPQHISIPEEMKRVHERLTQSI